MAHRYLHFTDLTGLEGIKKSNKIWKSSYGPENSVFAVCVAGAWVPGVQMSSMGRAKIRSQVVIFETDMLPDIAYPEEVIWHMDNLPIKIVNIVSPGEAKKLLNDTLKFNEETGLLEVPLHPAFNNPLTGTTTRMPRNFGPWLPGRDNEKYFIARKIWLETDSVKSVADFWLNK